MRSSTKLRNLVEKLGAHCDQLIAAPHFFATVHSADHILMTLYDIGNEVEHFVKTSKETNPRRHSEREKRSTVLQMLAVTQPEHEHGDRHPPLEGQPFKSMTIADASRMLLKERGVLHGPDIERLLIEGGYPTASKHFQSTMVVAFQRDGGFENVGRNRWRLKQSVSSESGREAGEAKGERASGT